MYPPFLWPLLISQSVGPLMDRLLIFHFIDIIETRYKVFMNMCVCVCVNILFAPL